MGAPQQRSKCDAEHPGAHVGSHHHHHRHAGESSRPIGFEDDGSLASYRRLLPYLGRAAAFAERVQRSQAEPHCARAALDMLRVPALCLDAHLRPVWMNKAAEMLLRRNDGLRLPARASLAAATAGETERLHAALRAAGRAQGGSVQLWQPSRQAALYLVAIPYPTLPGPMHALTDNAQSARVMVFVFDQSDCLGAAEHALHGRLRALFGLTATEALIGIQIARGAGIPAIAKAARLQASTIRTHAKQIFMKTGVHSQAELTCLVVQIGTLAP